MSPRLQGILIGLVAAALIAGALVWLRRPTAVASADLRAEVAAERIPDIKAEGQAARKAAKARVTREVHDAVRDSDLVDFLGSREPR
jgi:hypothetical protein